MLLFKFLKNFLFNPITGIVVLVILIFIVGGTFFGVFRKTYTRQDLIENLNSKKVQIFELQEYFRSIVPENKQVEIEFESDTKLFRFGVYPIDPVTGEIIYPIFLEWNLSTSSNQVQSIISTIGWTNQTLKKLKEKLDKANCIQIESGNPTKIGYQRSGLAMYAFYVFNNAIRDSIKKYYIDSCSCIIYGNSIVLNNGYSVGLKCLR